MEVEKKVKKNNTPLLIILASVLLIAAGVILIVTGNNKSFWEKEEPKDANKQEQNTNENKLPNKGILSRKITEDDIAQLIKATKEIEFPEENWKVENVTIIAHDEANEKFLISYSQIYEDSSIIVKQTIVSSINGDVTVELPGWAEGERDLTVYNFSKYESFEVPGIDVRPEGTYHPDPTIRYNDFERSDYFVKETPEE